MKLKKKTKNTPRWKVGEKCWFMLDGNTQKATFLSKRKRGYYIEWSYMALGDLYSRNSIVKTIYRERPTPRRRRR